MSRRSYVINVICTLAGLVTLTQSRALFAPYLLAAVFSLWCLTKEDHDTKTKRSVIILSAVAAFFMLIANYQIWLRPAMPEVRTVMFVRFVKCFLIAVIFSGSFFAVRNILVFLSSAGSAGTSSGNESPENEIPENERAGQKTGKYFVIPFILISVTWLVIYSLCYYPGLCSLDSIDQIDQIFTGVYSNHQPFYHTLLIGLFIRPAIAVFGSMNAAVACYVVFQLLFLAATFAFAVRTMADLRLPKWSMTVATIWYMIMPFHIMFSFTVWKDVYFGAFITLLILFYIRLSHGIGKSALNTAGFAACGPFICLIRSNGLFTYIFVLIAVLILARRQRRIIIIMCVTVAASFILKHPVLTAAGVTQPDTVESLSIPLQQISRVITEDGNISAEDLSFLSGFMDIEAVKTTYNPDISDPIKNMIRDLGHEDVLTGNMGTFLGVYVRTFFKNPMKYITAWVDSTCGYWNSGYNYWVWFWDVESNSYGIEQVVTSPALKSAMDQYLWLYYNNPLLQLFTATGMFAWVVFFLFIRCIYTKNTTGMIAAVPILAIILSLVISSPVYAEFRYMYALFCVLPALIAQTERCENEDNVQ